MSLRVIRPGACSLIVDRGRQHSRSRGLPIGGPADYYSMALGNALLGNSPTTAALEITLAGPVLVADATVGLCLFGAPFSFRRDSQAIPSCHSFTLTAGQTLTIDGTTSGCRAYLCVKGGFFCESIAGSQSSFQPLQAGDVLECASSSVSGVSLDLGTVREAKILRCLPGPQADWFDGSFFEAICKVLPASNRMGLRLEGPKLTKPDRELISEPVSPGAIQITNEGLPIVLGVDGQTIGGYPKIAHVISTDLDRLGQLRPGDEVRFRLVDELEAESAGQMRRADLEDWVRRIKLMSA